MIYLSDRIEHLQIRALHTYLVGKSYLREYPLIMNHCLHFDVIA